MGSQTSINRAYASKQHLQPLHFVQAFAMLSEANTLASFHVAGPVPDLVAAPGSGSAAAAVGLSGSKAMLFSPRRAVLQVQSGLCLVFITG